MVVTFPGAPRPSPSATRGGPLVAQLRLGTGLPVLHAGPCVQAVDSQTDQTRLFYVFLSAPPTLPPTTVGATGAVSSTDATAAAATTEATTVPIVPTVAPTTIATTAATTTTTTAATTTESPPSTGTKTRESGTAHQPCSRSPTHRLPQTGGLGWRRPAPPFVSTLKTHTAGFSVW